MEGRPDLPLRGDEAKLFAEFDATLRSRVQRDVQTSRANVEDACAFAWLQFLRRQPDRDREWRAWLVQVARREAYRLSRVEWRAPVRTPDLVPENLEAADPRADLDQTVELGEALELLAQLRPRLGRVAFLRATGHTHAQIQEVLGVSHTRAGQLVRRAHEALWEAAAVRQRAETPQAPRAERLHALEEDPPDWLIETLGPPPRGRDRATELLLWRRAALALDDYRELAARGRATELEGQPGGGGLERLRGAALRAVERYREASTRGLARDGLGCER